MPVPAPTDPRPTSSTADRAPRRRQGRRDVVVLHVHAAGVGEPRVVAFPHDRDHHVVDTDPRLFVHQEAACRVVDPTDLHGRGQEDRALDDAPFLDLRPSRQLACAVEHRHPGGHRRGPDVAAGIENGDAGAGDTRARGRVGVIGDHRRVAQARRPAHPAPSWCGRGVRRRWRPPSQPAERFHPSAHRAMLPGWRGEFRWSSTRVVRSTIRRRRSGSACGLRAPRSPNASRSSNRRCAELGHEVVPAREFDDNWLSRVHSDELLDHLATVWDRWVDGGYPDLGAQRVVPVSVPERRTPSRPTGATAHRTARPGRRVLLRHDDARRPWQLASDPGRHRRRPHRGRPRRIGRPGGLRRCQDRPAITLAHRSTAGRAI